jgi:3-methyladenine DNA glycosylase/8-oxoguanine DNA glycosylase
MKKRLDQNTPSIKYLSQKDKHLAKVIKMVGPIEYQVATDGYAFLISQIIGQMLSNKVAAVLMTRFEDICQNDVCLTNVERLTDEKIHSIGLSKSKAAYIHNLTQAITDHELELSQFSEMSDQDIIKQLTKVKGIGNWSAKMYLIFSLDRQNILPFEDLAFLEGYGWTYKTDDYSAKSVQKKCKKMESPTLQLPPDICIRRLTTV